MKALDELYASVFSFHPSEEWIETINFRSPSKVGRPLLDNLIHIYQAFLGYYNGLINFTFLDWNKIEYWIA
jgi:hypothetical protein